MKRRRKKKKKEEEEKIEEKEEKKKTLPEKNNKFSFLHIIGLEGEVVPLFLPLICL